MYGPLELKALIDQRHEGALRDAQTRRLARRAQSGGRTRELPTVGPAWRNMLTLLLRGVKLAG
jgi:hypothetical protein